MPVGAFLSFPACLFRDGRPPCVDYKFLQSGCPPDIGEYLGLYGGIPTAGRQECHCAGEHELQELLGISPVAAEYFLLWHFPFNFLAPFTIQKVISGLMLFFYVKTGFLLVQYIRKCSFMFTFTRIFQRNLVIIFIYIIKCIYPNKTITDFIPSSISSRV